MGIIRHSDRRGVIGAGNWIVDHLNKIDRWPAENELCNIIGNKKSPGGGPCNVLFDLAALQTDLPLYAAGRLGSDTDGDWMMAEIAGRNIDSRFMRRSAGKNTSFTEVMENAGRRTFFHCRGANAELSVDDLADIDVPAAIFYLGYLLLLDRLDAADPEYGTASARLLAAMCRKGYFTVVDMVSEARKKFTKIVPAALPHIDALVINEIEAGYASGIELRRTDGMLMRDALRPAGQALLQAGVRKLVAIHFPEGAYGLTRTEEYFQPSYHLPPERIVGSTGAGDAFCAGLIYGLHEQKTLAESLRMGVVSARFNLLSAEASAGAPTDTQLKAYVKTIRHDCEYSFEKGLRMGNLINSRKEGRCR